MNAARTRRPSRSKPARAVERTSRTKRTSRSKRRKYWSAAVTRGSDALDLTPRVFTGRSPRRIAQSLKRSAESSRRRKGTPLQSSMSMLNFYLNRAGGNLPASRRRVLEQAKGELRKLFGR